MRAPITTCPGDANVLEPRRQVRRVADGREVAQLVAADVADEGRSAVDPDPESRPLGAVGGDPIDGSLEGQRRPRCPQGVIGLADRRIEDRHQRVADELGDRAALAQHDRDGRPEVGVEHGDDVGRRGPLGEWREAREVREQDGNLADLAAECRAVRSSSSAVATSGDR